MNKIIVDFMCISNPGANAVEELKSQGWEIYLPKISYYKKRKIRIDDCIMFVMYVEVFPDEEIVIFEESVEAERYGADSAPNYSLSGFIEGSKRIASLVSKNSKEIETRGEVYFYIDMARIFPVLRQISVRIK